MSVIEKLMGVGWVRRRIDWQQSAFDILTMESGQGSWAAFFCKIAVTVDCPGMIILIEYWIRSLKIVLGNFSIISLQLLALVYESDWTRVSRPLTEASLS
jgi:hypothetical protein